MITFIDESSSLSFPVNPPQDLLDERYNETVKPVNTKAPAVKKQISPLPVQVFQI
jgi:hypothetical protein